MSVVRRSLLVALIGVAPVFACAAPTDDTTEAADELSQNEKGVTLTDKDNGATVTVTEGQSVVVQLPSEASYAWSVVEVDKSFGAPKVRTTSKRTSFTWGTKSPVGSLVGDHAVKLAYTKKGAKKAEKTFSFTVKIVSPALTLTDADNGATATVIEGKDIVVELPANRTTGYQWIVTSVDKSFGAPKEEYETNKPALVGTGGTSRFRWSTSSTWPVGSLAGKHEVTLAYQRPFEKGVKPIKTFAFTANILSESVETGVSNDIGSKLAKKSVDVVRGQKLVVLLEPEYPSRWRLDGVSKSLGYPVETTEELATDDTVPGIYQQFTWSNTASAFGGGDVIFGFYSILSDTSPATKKLALSVNLLPLEPITKADQ